MEKFVKGESRKYLRLTLASGSRFGMVDWDGLESYKVFTEAKIEGSTGSSASNLFSLLYFVYFLCHLKEAFKVVWELDRLALSTSHYWLERKPGLLQPSWLHTLS